MGRLGHPGDLLCSLDGKENPGGKMKLFKPALSGARACDEKSPRLQKKRRPREWVLNGLTQN
jgi:hypothetical protein